jgi:hypothetical protein
MRLVVHDDAAGVVAAAELRVREVHQKPAVDRIIFRAQPVTLGASRSRDLQSRQSDPDCAGLRDEGGLLHPERRQSPAKALVVFRARKAPSRGRRREIAMHHRTVERILVARGVLVRDGCGRGADEGREVDYAGVGGSPRMRKGKS